MRAMATRDAIATETLTIEYEDAGDGWITAQVVECPGAMSQGRTQAEARSNVLDALRELERTPRVDPHDLTTHDAIAVLLLRVAETLQESRDRLRDLRRPRATRH